MVNPSLDKPPASRLIEGMNNTVPDLKKTMEVAVEAVCRGRKVLTEHFGQLKNVREKLRAGLVTEADETSEKEIQVHLKKHFPDFDFWGEESFDSSKETKLPEKYTWVLDPLDGTTNYVHGFPLFCISLALVHHDQVLLGIVDAPMMNMSFKAIKGEGATCNDEKISVSQRATLHEALLATGFYPHDEDLLTDQLDIFRTFLPHVRGIRRGGSAALDLCLVGQGVFDAFWEKHLKPWDTAAGTVIVREAGGVVRNFQGYDYKVTDAGILASNPILLPVLEESIHKVIYR